MNQDNKGSLSFKCPYCGVAQYLRSELSVNAFYNQYWSDRFVFNGMMQNHSPVLKCCTCGRYFFTSESEVFHITNVQAKNNFGWLSYYDIKKAFLQLLPAGPHSTKEIILRTVFVWKYNDLLYRNVLNNARLSKPSVDDRLLFFENAMKLADLLDGGIEDKVLKAELYREMSMFDRCISVLDSLKDETRCCNIISMIRQAAEESDSRTFELSKYKLDAPDISYFKTEGIIVRGKKEKPKIVWGARTETETSEKDEPMSGSRDFAPVNIQDTTCPTSEQECHKESVTMTLYDFEYNFIPLLLGAYIKGEIHAEAFGDSNWMRESIMSQGIILNVDFSLFQCFWKGMDEKHDIVLYKFPEPENPPLAKFGAVILPKERKVEAAYYTLEKSKDIKSGDILWTLGAFASDKHDSLGFVEDCNTVDEFYELLKKRITGRSIKDKLKDLIKDIAYIPDESV